MRENKRGAKNEISRKLKGKGRNKKRAKRFFYRKLAKGEEGRRPFSTKKGKRRLFFSKN